MSKLHTLEVQFNEMLSRNTIPCFEYEMNDGEYLVVNISLSHTPKGRFRGIEFNFDQDGKDVYFDSETMKLGGGAYCVKVDSCFDDLDSYLQAIDNDITEGFLLANNLYKA